jgi:hypothetical protein
MTISKLPAIIVLFFVIVLINIVVEIFLARYIRLNDVQYGNARCIH